MDSTTTMASALRHSISPRHRGQLAIAMALALVALVLIGLLTAFVQVLHGAVAQANQRWRDEAVEAEATWRCKALHVPAARMSCLAQLATARSGP